MLIKHCIFAVGLDDVEMGQHAPNFRCAGFNFKVIIGINDFIVTGVGLAVFKHCNGILHTLLLHEVPSLKQTIAREFEFGKRTLRHKKLFVVFQNRKSLANSHRSCVRVMFSRFFYTSYLIYHYCAPECKILKLKTDIDNFINRGRHSVLAYYSTTYFTLTRICKIAVYYDPILN